MAPPPDFGGSGPIMKPDTGGVFNPRGTIGGASGAMPPSITNDSLGGPMVPPTDAGIIDMGRIIGGGRGGPMAPGPDATTNLFQSALLRALAGR